MKIAGAVLLIIGLIGFIISVVDYINKTNRFSFLGLEVTISEGSLVPLIISGVVFLLGTILIIGKRK